MKKGIISLVKKAGEKAAYVPIEARSWPWFIHQSPMPESLRAKMEAQDKR